MRSRVFLGVIAGLLIATGVVAAPLDEGREAARTGDYETALRLLAPLADQGNRDAQFVVGVLYANGRGVAKDAEAAAVWYRRAADQGLPEAQNNLGALYSDGEGVPHDHALAKRWWSLAASQGFARAQTNLAGLELDGDGVPQDYVQAYKWAFLASIQGEADAVETLDRLQKLMTTDQIAEAQRLIADWRPAGIERT